MGLTRALALLHLGRHTHLALRTVDEPVTRFFETHTAGLPLTPTTAHALWLGSGALALLLSAVTRAFSARLTWTLWGAATALMAWSGTGAASRSTATGIVAIAWGLVSIVALNGVGTRPRTTTINLFGDVPKAMQPKQPAAHDSPDKDEARAQT